MVAEIDGTNVKARAMLGAQPDAPKRCLVRRAFHRAGREFVALFVVLYSIGHRLGRTLLQTEYVVTGGCKKRGVCCNHILLEWVPFFDRHPWAARIVLWKLTRFYSFYDKGYTWEVEDGLMARVLGCHALQPDGRCGEYRIRPRICRTYPEVPLEGPGMVLKGCGYGFEQRAMLGHSTTTTTPSTSTTSTNAPATTTTQDGVSSRRAAADAGMLVQISRRRSSPQTSRKLK
ncbi:MAG: hypothetical protein IPK13_25410 [Deltaproteobacteria bacterium]|nr:hypothetical protein [Deltaproteobacteria bacterium]